VLLVTPALAAFFLPILALSTPVAAAIAVAVIIGVVLLWKLLKFVFRIAIIIVAVAIIYYVLNNAGLLPF